MERPNIAAQFASFVAAIFVLTTLSRALHARLMRLFEGRAVTRPARVEWAIVLMLFEYAALQAIAGWPNWWFFTFNPHVAEIGFPHLGLYAGAVGFALFETVRAIRSPHHRLLAVGAWVALPAIYAAYAFSFVVYRWTHL